MTPEHFLRIFLISIGWVLQGLAVFIWIMEFSTR